MKTDLPVNVGGNRLMSRDSFDIGLIDPEAVMAQLDVCESHVKGIGKARAEQLAAQCIQGGAKAMARTEFDEDLYPIIRFLVRSPIKAYRWLLCELFDPTTAKYDAGGHIFTVVKGYQAIGPALRGMCQYISDF